MTGAYARALCGVLFVVVAAAAGYAAIPAIPPPEAQTLGPPDQPALSCPPGKEEIAAFEGSGDKVTPAFESTGNLWGYEFASVGYGTLRIGVLSETGEVVPDLNEPSRAGSGGAPSSPSGRARSGSV